MGAVSIRISTQSTNGSKMQL